MSDRPTDIEVIFINSVVNGGIYYGDHLPIQNWDWPTETWFQQRLARVREEQSYAPPSDC